MIHQKSQKTHLQRYTRLFFLYFYIIALQTTS